MSDTPPPKQARPQSESPQGESPEGDLPEGDLPEIDLPEVDGRTPIPHQAAMIAALNPAFVIILIIGIGIVARLPAGPNPQESNAVFALLVALPAVGVLAALIALSGIPRYGTQKLLMRGLIGLVLNGAILANILLSIRMLLSGEAPPGP